MRKHGWKLALLYCLFVSFTAAAQKKSPRLSDADLVRLIAQRPSLARFLRLYEQHRNDRAAFANALVAANIQPKVKRMCYVSGGYPEQVVCVALDDVLNRHFELLPSDRELIELSFNDVWEALGGKPAGGDLMMCGGSAPKTVTHMVTSAQSQRQAVLTTDPKGKPQRLTGASAQAMVSACRAKQTSSINGGIGLYTPGSPDYQRAVQRTSSFLTGMASGCRSSSTDMVAEPPSGGGTAPPQMGAGEALAWVAGVTTDLAGGLAECTSKAKCALSLSVMAVGLVTDANDLLGNEGDVADVIEAGDAVLDVIGGAMGAVAVAQAATAAEAVLPAIAVGVAAYTVYRPIGDAIAWAADPLYVAITDPPAEEPKKKDAGGGVKMPSPDGTPTCEAIAERAARFNAYCSQPGNNWRSYDCMIFVARLNGCADPGVVRPAPGEDFTCSPRRDEREKQQVACERRERVRGWLKIATGAGRCGAVAGLMDMKDKMRRDLCTRVLTDGGNDFCGGMRGRARPQP